MASSVTEGQIQKLRNAGYLSSNIAHRLPDDGEHVVLHLLELENMPLRQAMGACKGFPPTAKIHDVRGGEVDVDPHAAIPAAPHV